MLNRKPCSPTALLSLHAAFKDPMLLATLLRQLDDVQLDKRGFNPQGGGTVRLSALGSPGTPLPPLVLSTAPKWTSLTVRSFSAGGVPAKAAQSMSDAASRRLRKVLAVSSLREWQLVCVKQVEESWSCKLLSVACIDSVAGVWFKTQWHGKQRTQPAVQELPDLEVEVLQPVRESKESAHGSGGGLLLTAHSAGSPGCIMGAAGLLEGRQAPEAVGAEAARQLAEDVRTGGCLDRWCAGRLATAINGCCSKAC